MSLSERIQNDLVDAMRAKDELRLSVLRGMKAAIKHKEVEKIRVLDEAESIQILQTLVKQRKESIEQFTKGNRPELADKETKELAILESYLPASASNRRNECRHRQSHRQNRREFHEANGRSSQSSKIRA